MLRRLTVMFLLAALLSIGLACGTANAQPAAGAGEAPAPAAPTDKKEKPEARPIGRVWGTHSVTSGVGPRGLNPNWDKVGQGQSDWRSEFAVVLRNLITPFGKSPADGGQGFDEILIYRPWGIEDHVENRAMVFDALERARARVDQLPPGSPGATAVRRMVDVDAFIDNARAAQDTFGRPFWYYMGQCNDPTLTKRTLAQLDDYVLRSAEPVIIVGGNIFIDDSGSKGADSTAWLVAQSLKRLGVKRVGYEPAAATIGPTNNAPLKGGSTQFTPWAHEPEMVGMITGPLWKNRIEWRDPRELNAQERDKNTRAWMVPLHLTAGEVVIWGYAPDQQEVDWLVGRLADGWSVVVGPGELTKLKTTPAALRAAAQAKRDAKQAGR